MLPLKILGLGRYLPKRIVFNAEIESKCNLPSGWIERWSGVHQRHWASSKETNSFMGAEAAKEAITKSKLSLDDIDLIINASGTPEQAIPDGGALLQRQLGISMVPAFTVHATCLSFLVGLDVSASLLATKRYRHILLVSADVGSVALNFNEPESASLIGDAAAAAVITLPHEKEATGILASRFETYGEAAHLTEIRGGGSRYHPNNSITQPVDNLFHMDGSKILREVHRHGKLFLERLQPTLSTTLGNIDLVIPHQASLAGVRSLRYFGWSSDQIAVTLGHLGNCISASIPATMYQLVEEGRLVHGQTILLVGTGAGLSFGGIILAF